ncbi:MAG: hypothetical protein ACI81L_001123 [Verrucomicrobiales bacterium]|jgi:hypothetical protein
MVDLMLSEFIGSDSPADLLEPATAAVTLIARDWTDRAADADAVAVGEAWTNLVDDIDGEPSPEQMDTAADILD